MKPSRYADTINALESHRARIREAGLARLVASFECRHAIARLEVRVAAIGRWLDPQGWRDTAHGVAIAQGQVSLARGAVDHARAEISDEVARMAEVLAEHPGLATAYQSTVADARAALDRIAAALDADRDRLEARIEQHIEAAAAALTAADLAPLQAAEAQSAVERGLHGLRDMLHALPQQLLVARVDMDDDAAWIREADAVLAAVDVTIGLVPRVYRAALADPVHGWRHWSTIRRFEGLLARARGVVAEALASGARPERSRPLSFGGPPASGGRDRWLPPELEAEGIGAAFESDPEGPFDAPADADLGHASEFGPILELSTPTPSCHDVAQHHAAMFEFAANNPPAGCRTLEGRQLIQCAADDEGMVVVARQEVKYACDHDPLLELPPKIKHPDVRPMPNPEPIKRWSAPWKGLDDFTDDVGKLLDETGDQGLQAVLDATARLDADRAWFDERIHQARAALDEAVVRVGPAMEQSAEAVEAAPRSDFDAPVPVSDGGETDYLGVYIKAFVEGGLGMIGGVGDQYDVANFGCGMLTGYTLLGDPVEDGWDAASLLIAAVLPLVGRPHVAAALAVLRRAVKSTKGLPRAVLLGIRRLYVTGRAARAAVDALLEQGGDLVRQSEAFEPLAKALAEIEPRLDRWYAKAAWSAGKSTAKQFAIDVALDAAHEMTLTVAEQGDDFVVQVVIDGQPVDRHGDPVSPADPAAWMPLDALGVDTLEQLER